MIMSNSFIKAKIGNLVKRDYAIETVRVRRSADNSEGFIL